MSCSVAISSPVAFSPSRIPLACKTSPETLTLAPHHIYQPDGSPSASCGTSSPFRHRFQRPASGLRAFSSTSPASVDLSLSPAGLVAESGKKGSVLKRKRPARIDIPSAEALSFLEPGKSDGVREVEQEGERYSVFCKRGRKRIEMEDRFRADVCLLEDPQMAFFGVFDGHGGTKAVEFASENLGRRIIDELATRGDECAINEAVKRGYLRTDAEFLKEEEVGGGACCVTALIRNGDLVISNAGDCRAVLCRGGVAEALTTDHRPSREDERDRIERLGGYVECCRGIWRLQGSLAVSRGIGDLHLKQWVIPDPDTSILRIKPDCEFVILASDGLWDKVSNQEAVDVARPLCSGSEKKPLLLSACKKLADLSATRGSMDDISVMIIQLGQFARREE